MWKFFAFFTLIFALNASSSKKNMMMCAQNLISSLDTLKVLGEHASDENFLALQATVMAFAFNINMLKTYCGIDFDARKGQSHFDQDACIANSQAFYNLISPKLYKPQDVLTDQLIFTKALDSFNAILDTCNVDFDDTRNKIFEQMIEEDGDINLDEIAKVLQGFTGNKGKSSKSQSDFSSSTKSEHIVQYSPYAHNGGMELDVS